MTLNCWLIVVCLYQPQSPGSSVTTESNFLLALNFLHRFFPASFHVARRGEQSWSLSLLRLEEGKARYWRDIEHVLRLSPPRQTGKEKSDNLDIKSYHSSFSFFLHVLDNLKNTNNRNWLWITPDIGTPHGISIIFFLSSTLFSRDTLILVTAGVGSVGNVGNDSNLLSYLLTSNINEGYQKWLLRYLLNKFPEVSFEYCKV